jgi:hypothetical protein
MPTLRVPDTIAAGEGSPASASSCAVAELARQIDASPLARGSNVRCVVPARFARYLLVPWNADMQSPAARQVFAEHCFGETFGEMARNWVVRVDSAAWERAALACAIDAALLDDLARITVDRGLTLCSVQPALMHEVNAIAAPLPAGASWIVVPEAGVLTLLLVEGREPLRVAVVAGTLPQLPAILAREWFSLGRDEPCAPAHVCGMPIQATAPTA